MTSGSEPHDLAAVALWEAGHRQSALEAGRKALEFSPQDARLRANVEIMERLLRSPAWEPDALPGRQAVGRAVERLLVRIGEDPEAACDTRSAHREMFKSLSPPEAPEFAGHYRGEPFPSLADRAVRVPADHALPADLRFGAHEPGQTPSLMDELGRDLRARFVDVDAAWRDETVPEVDRRRLAVNLACYAQARVFAIHPYVNGNGHAGRFALWAVLARYGLRPSRWTIEPSPQISQSPSESRRKYLDLVGKWIDGETRPLEDLLFADVCTVEPVALPTVSILIPHLGREEGLARCVRSIAALDYPRELLEVVVIPGAGTVPEKVARGVAETSGEVLAFAANDMEYEPACLRLAVEAGARARRRLVALNGGALLPDLGNVCEHFVAWRSLLPMLERGELFSTDFHHVGVDNWLWAQATRLGEAIRCEDARVVHHHFSRGAAWDAIYARGWSRVAEDRATLARKISGSGSP